MNSRAKLDWQTRRGRRLHGVKRPSATVQHDPRPYASRTPRPARPNLEGDPASAGSSPPSTSRAQAPAWARTCPGSSSFPHPRPGLSQPPVYTEYPGNWSGATGQFRYEIARQGAIGRWQHWSGTTGQFRLRNCPKGGDGGRRQSSPTKVLKSLRHLPPPPLFPSANLCVSAPLR